MTATTGACQRWLRLAWRVSSVSFVRAGTFLQALYFPLTFVEFFRKTNRCFRRQAKGRCSIDHRYGLGRRIPDDPRLSGFPDHVSHPAVTSEWGKRIMDADVIAKSDNVLVNQTLLVTVHGFISFQIAWLNFSSLSRHDVR